MIGLLVSHFRFGQTWSETKTLQIVLESFCVYSPAHSSFSREAPLSCPPSPPWNLSFFTVESILFYPCSRSDFPLAKMWLSLTLTLLHLTIWCFGQTALFLFLLAKAAPAYLPAAFSVALRPLFPFQKAQYVQVFPLKPAPFCTPFAGFGSTNKSSTPFFYLTLLHLSFYLNLFGGSGKNCLLSPAVLSGYNRSPDTRFSRGTMRLMSCPDGERYSRLLQSFVVSLLSTLVFSRTGGYCLI